MQSKHVEEKPDLCHPIIYVKHIERIKMKQVMLVLPDLYVLRSCLYVRLHQPEFFFFSFFGLGLPSIPGFTWRMDTSPSQYSISSLVYRFSAETNLLVTKASPLFDERKLDYFSFYLIIYRKTFVSCVHKGFAANIYVLLFSSTTSFVTSSSANAFFNQQCCVGISAKDIRGGSVDPHRCQSRNRKARVPSGKCSWWQSKNKR